MTRIKLVDGKEVALTDAENLSRDIEDAVLAEKAVADAVYAKIIQLEVEITPRRLRDAVLGVESPANWLFNQEVLIAAERSKL